MKKTISLLLALVLCLSLCACGGGNDTPEATETNAPEEAVPTKEELLAQALAVDDTTINNDSFENLAKAKSLYCNAVLLLEGTVFEIKEDHVVIGQGGYWSVDAYLPLEDLVVLERGQQLVVVGQTTDEIIEEQWSMDDWSETHSHYQMPTAYFVDDYFEFQGKLKGKNGGYEDGWNFFVGDLEYGRIVYFADGVDLSAFNTSSNGNPGENITIRSKTKFENNTWVYYDATIVAVEESNTGSADERLLTFSYEDRVFFKEYVQTLTPMTEDEIRTVLADNTFKMRNNYGGDGDGTHSITFYADGSLDASYTASDGQQYTMYESWTIKDGAVVLTHSFTNTYGEQKTSEYVLTPYQYDANRYLLIHNDGDSSMVLTIEE